ncbi:WD repeat-containing protein 70 [Plasmodium brasilianum]|uniref:WD repeat-containing protein 70, putative n=2 Tax=Plasmodium (Plasmodium) TaxID=418103 RepID=A0A1A8VS99_PLAMA|nr:WD repeat-containing protein 70, putative [Plasmodium malariae]KAI4837976.1 WD repeat-containing protein 70 [Plasmodium brasilianum]SBS83411.1 WD repeat-containing protein 70, putative (WDR70) [Plasmodium malariae]SCN45189.1 WD repeat-containing protein 70, putative [Plasmodium malariae]
MNNEDVVGEDEYLDEFSDGSASNEFSTNSESSIGQSDERKRDNEKGDEHNAPLDEGFDKQRSKLNFALMKEEILNIHKKNICEIRSVRKGSTLVVSGNDNNVRIYEFKNMNKYEKGYTKLISLSEGSIIQSLDAQNNITLIANGNKCYVYNRNYELIKNTIRGDMYIKDVNKTKGHTRQINSCRINPSEENVFISGSLDSTLRIWNLTKNNCYGIDNELVHHQCLKIVNEKNMMNNNILCSEFCMDGNTIIIGCESGQLEIRNKISNDYMYSYKGTHIIKPNVSHNNYAVIDILTSKKRNHYFYTRSLDSTVKYWDRRNLNIPINTIENINTIVHKSNMCFYDKDEKYLVIGTQEKKISKKEENVQNAKNQAYEYIENRLDFEEEKTQKLKDSKKEFLTNSYIKIYQGDDDMNKFLNEVSTVNKTEKNIHGMIQIYDITTNTFDLIYKKYYEHSGIICVHYDEYIKHLFLGTTDGKCFIYYDHNSKNGVLEYINKGAKRKEQEVKEKNNSFYMNTEHIYNLDNLPKEIEITHSGKVLIKKHNKKNKLNPTINALNSNAYERKRQVNPYSKFIVDVKQNSGERMDEIQKGELAREHTDEEENIVDLLRKRELNKQGDDYFMKAYKYTQPNKIIDYSSGEEQEYSKILKKPKCPQCGVKNCVCGYMQGLGRKTGSNK